MTTPRKSTSTQTPFSSSGSDETPNDPGAAADMEGDLRLQLFRSLTRIERHLKRQDPEALRCISEWYSAKGSTGCTMTATVTDDASGGARRSPGERRRRHLKKTPQKRMEQNEINNTMIQYLRIPTGVATRSLLVPPQPAWVFANEPPLTLPPLGPDESVAGFRWLPPDSNVSNAVASSRRFMEREMMKQRLDRWVFLFFRLLRRNWESCVVEEKRVSADVNMYAEENIGKWTRKLRFKIMRQAPIKTALNAFLCRMGLVGNVGIVFCRDGFYGLMDVGNASGDFTKTPCAMVSFSSTPRYLGLKNGDSIFVNSCGTSQRQMMEEAPRQDAPKKYGRQRVDSFDNEEEGEFEIDVDSSDLDRAFEDL